MQLFKMGILWNMAGGNAQSLACGYSPGSLWVKAESIEEVWKFPRSHERTFVQPDSIAFPGTTVCVGKECSTKGHCHPFRGQRHTGAGRPLDFASTEWENIPTLVSTSINLNVWEWPQDSVSHPPASVSPQTWGVAFAPLEYCPLQ